MGKNEVLETGLWFTRLAEDFRNRLSFNIRHSIFFLLFFFILLPLSAEIFTFKADHMTGSRPTGKEITILTGNAEVHSDKLILQADKIEIQGNNNEFIDCVGNVSGREAEKEIFFKTDRLRYDRNLKVARLEGDSTMEDRKNSIVAKGRFIEYDDQNDSAIFQVGVRLFKDDLVCRGQYAMYRRKEKLLNLSGFPVVFKKRDEFRADRIRVDLDTNDVAMEGAVSGEIKD
ncbi:MAG: hypothetical protein LBI40_01135 [Treponema sp.]|jgi:lipopolysaccharide export system protein LptA|nr:hypothetical protein [Treponema sp.]